MLFNGRRDNVARFECCGGRLVQFRLQDSLGVPVHRPSKCSRIDRCAPVLGGAIVV
jgi:hypothetical protein